MGVQCASLHCLGGLARALVLGFLLLLPVAAPAGERAPIGPDITVSALDNEQVAPAVAYNSLHDEYLVVWENDWPGNKDIYATRISSTGALLGWWAVTYGDEDRIQPAVAYDPVRDRYLVVWSVDFYGDGSDYDIVGRFFPWNGPDPLLQEFPVCDWTTSQFDPDVAFALTQDEFLVAWTESTTSGFRIGASRISADGSGSPTGPWTVSSGTEDRRKPSVAYNLHRNEYLLTWEMLNSSFDVWAVRLRGDGVPLGTGEFAVASETQNETSPVVAACRLADNYLLLYEMEAGDMDVYGRFISGAGTVGATVYLVAITLDHEWRPAVSCDAAGGSYVSVWQVQHSGVDDTLQRWVCDAATREPQFIGTFAESSTPDEIGSAAVGGGVGSWLVAFEADRSGTSYQDVHARLVYGAGIFADDFESGGWSRWSSAAP
jgi:hypothetical protein